MKEENSFKKTMIASRGMHIRNADMNESYAVALNINKRRY